uniref:Impact N-terminal domain-containing protein n=1 Tax=Magallana gigas TaxID=29159 RepID=K1Q8I3_MAGGI
MGTRPTADEVISGDTMKLSVSAGDQMEDNGNRFASHAPTVDSFKKVRESLVEILRIPTISSASHNVIAYRFVSFLQHEGSDDDGEHVAGRAMQRTICHVIKRL